MARYRVQVEGCDDETVVELELSPDEVELLTHVAALVTAESRISCNPTMKIEPVEVG